MYRKPLKCSREGKNGQICLKFETRIALVNPWGVFFFFFLKILTFGSLGPSPRP